MDGESVDAVDGPILDLSNQLNLQLTESELLLRRLYKLSKGLDADDHRPAKSFYHSNSEFCQKLVKRFPEGFIGHAYDKASAGAARNLQLQAESIISCLHPAYELFQSVAYQQNQAIELLSDLHKLLSDLTMEKAPALLHSYMHLFVCTVRIGFLLAACPRKLIAQMYSAAYAMAYGVEPPLRRDVCDFLAEADDAVATMQKQMARFAPRIVQVMQQVVCPVLMAVSTCSSLSASGLLEVIPDPAAAGTRHGVAGLSHELAVLLLQDIHQLHSWAYMAFLACPECVQDADCRELLGVLLRQTFLLPVYRDHTEWIHPLCEAHVKPALAALYSRMKQEQQITDKAALQQLRRSVKNLVAEAAAEACLSCTREHLARRVFLAQLLQQMHAYVQDEVEGLTASLSTVFAALSCSSSEVLWYFQHTNEQLPRGFPAQGSPQPLQEADEPSVVLLLAAMQALYELLVGYRSKINEDWIAEAEQLLQAAVEPQTRALTRSVSGIPGRAFAAEPLDYILKAVRRILLHARGLNSQPGSPSAASSALSSRDSSLPAASHERQIQQVKDLKAVWMGLLVACNNTRAVQRGGTLDALAQDPHYIHNIQQLILAAERVGDVVGAVDRHCRLQGLAFCAAKVHAMAARFIVTPGAPLLHAPALLQVVSWFEYCNSAECSATDYGALAEQQADLFLKATQQHIWTLSQACVRAASEGHQQAASTRPAAGGSSHGIMKRLLAGAAATETVATEDQPLASLVALLRGLEEVGSVKVSRRCVVVPLEYARDALAKSFLDHTARAAAFSQNVRVPSQLAAEVRAFMAMAGTLQCALEADLQTCLWEALLAHSWGSLPGQPLDAPGLPTMAGAIANWYVDVVVKDARGWGSMFAPQRRAFVAAVGAAGAPDLTQYTSVGELAALLEALGPYMALQLARRLQEPMQEAVDALDAALRHHQQPLDALVTAYRECGSCVEDCTRTATALEGPLAALAEPLKQLARCLALRSLLADALHHALGTHCPHILAAAATLPSTTGAPGAPTRDICDALHLPRPGTGGACSPAAADPALVSLFAGSDSAEKQARWSRLPPLLALTMSSPAWASSGPGPHYNAATRAFSNELHALVHVAHNLTVACQEANAGLPYAVHEAMCCFCHVAAFGAYQGQPDSSARACQLLLLDALVGPQLPRTSLEDCFVPSVRLWSAVSAASLRVAASG